MSLNSLQNELERTTQNRLEAAAKKREREKMLELITEENRKKYRLSMGIDEEGNRIDK